MSWWSEPLKYFLPEWDDRVDPNYDFLSDTYSKSHSEDPFKNDAYIWDVFGLENVPIDGVLVSRSKLEENKTKLRRIMEQGIHDFLHLPPDFEIMGDCGAFGYIEQDKPPFGTKETLEYYLNCRFNYGVSVDHLIVPKFDEQNEERWQITVDNAREMYDLWASKDNYLSNLRIIGVAQGWDVPSYRRSVHELLKIGYDYIGVGGLARAPTGQIGKTGSTKTVCNVMRGVSYEVKKWCETHKSKLDIHIFGFARPRLITKLQKMGVSSFDSASFLRSAWLSGNNYFTPKKNYKAIRVPDARRSPRTSRILKQNSVSQNKLTLLSERAMHSLRKFEQGKDSVENCLRAAKDYGDMVEVKKVHIEGYEEVLRDRPWKSCECPICRNIGIEVVIFRGNERNRRRGFHNIYVFYKEFRRLSPKVIVFTNCTGKKDENERLLTAYRRYLPSPVFKAFWNQVYDLPVEIKILSAKYGLIDFSKYIPYYDYKMREEDVAKFVDELEKKLCRYDKIFFTGLGFYRKAVDKVRQQTNLNIEIFPKLELTTRNKLDIIEYTKQMQLFRQAILDSIGETYSSSDLSLQKMLTEYKR